jgi:hypothetical protein
LVHGAINAEKVVHFLILESLLPWISLLRRYGKYLSSLKPFFIMEHLTYRVKKVAVCFNDEFMDH